MSCPISASGVKPEIAGAACTWVELAPNSGNLRLMIAGNNEAIMEQKYGDMGNSIRDRHKKEKGDFVMFADDDNWYFHQPPPVSCCTVIITRNSDAP